MYAQVLGSTTFGLNGHVIGVEVDINKNFPSFDIVGLPTTAVKESKERVHSAIRNSGYHFPVDKVTVNLAPADLKKDGSGLDLPIAIGLLAASGDVAKEALEGIMFIGELSLKGEIRPVPGQTVGAKLRPLRVAEVGVEVLLLFLRLLERRSDETVA